jgi:hypothetical protein
MAQAQAKQGEVKKRFNAIITQFTNELSLSYPELGSPITAYAKRKEDSIETFVSIVVALKPVVSGRKNESFLNASAPGVQILPGIYFSSAMWKDTSRDTRIVFWDYLTSLILLSDLYVKSKETPSVTKEEDEDENDIMPDLEKVIEQMTDGFKSEEFKNIFETVKGFTKDLPMPKAQKPASESPSEEENPAPFPEIPDHLKNGLIAKIATELAGEFKPEDLGIDPEMMENMNPLQVFEHLQFVYTNNPTLLTSAMKRVAKKIQNKFSSGSLNRDQLMAEAKELMSHFTDNPAFKDMFDNFGSIFTNPAEAFGGGGGGGSQQSERLRKVKERMRAKIDKKNPKK